MFAGWRSVFCSLLQPWLRSWVSSGSQASDCEECEEERQEQECGAEAETGGEWRRHCQGVATSDGLISHHCQHQP